MLASLEPAKRARPLVAVIGIDDAKETTGHLVPTDVLRRALWKREELGARLEPGMGEGSLALVADACSRTYRLHVTSATTSMEAVKSGNGVRIIPDLPEREWPEDRCVLTFPDHKPAGALDLALDAITVRYGERTTDVVALQLVYPRR
ncbi:hypothetical protein C7450_11318 [Chelatococcus asaccharovorans]|uniref:Uncharacterized protein n=2 Tax=Chelatococcus asaccharovorans TaxID=28210 RepID=A0A2V3TXY4_9HYPH|nr:hypothetical protein C7450_11318 [Chelatococcus asaccharovorans]